MKAAWWRVPFTAGTMASVPVRACWRPAQAQGPWYPASQLGSSQPGAELAREPPGGAGAQGPRPRALPLAQLFAAQGQLWHRLPDRRSFPNSKKVLQTSVQFADAAAALKAGGTPLRPTIPLKANAMAPKALERSHAVTAKPAELCWLVLRVLRSLFLQIVINLFL